MDAIYKDIHGLRHAAVLWNLVNWSNNEIIRCNGNAFVFNRMIGYNTAFYDLDTEDWYLNEVNPQAATCYIKVCKNNSEYIQRYSLIMFHVFQ